MRQTFILLIATATLVTYCDTVSATSADATSVRNSAAAFADALRPIEAAQLERKYNRYLRSFKTDNANDDSSDDLKPVYEERGVATEAVSKLTRLGNLKGNAAALQKADEVLAAIQSPKVKSLEQNLLAKLNENTLAQKLFGSYIDEKWTMDVLKTKLGVVKGMAPDSKEYEALTALLQTRMYVDGLLKLKTPAARANGESVLKQVSENPLAQKFFGQFMDETMTHKALKEALGITKTTSKATKEYKAFALLLDARALNNMLAKTKTGSLKENLMGRLTENPLAQKFFNQFVDEKWSTQTLRNELKITKGMAPDSKEYEALSSLLQTRMYINGVAKAKNQAVRTNTENLLTKLNDNPLAQKFFGQYMDESLTLAALKTELKIGRSTSKNSQEYEAVILLIQARAMGKTLV